MSFTVNVPFMVKSRTPPALIYFSFNFYGRLLVDYKVGGPHLRTLHLAAKSSHCTLILVIDCTAPTQYSPPPLSPEDM